MRSPNAGCETVREECLDHLLIISESHLRGVLAEYVKYYNQRRPHQGIEQRTPNPLSERRMTTRDPVSRRDVLGGIVHDYYRVDSHAA